MKREKPPNLGLWSPVGGKHEASLRESLYESAAREVREEVLIDATATDLKLRGIATERGDVISIRGHVPFPDEASEKEHVPVAISDYMLFLFEMNHPAAGVPSRGPEGEFRWFSPNRLLDADIPETDRKIFWPYVLAERAFFSVTIEWDGTKVTSHRIEEER